jgi:hypothetical protein
MGSVESKSKEIPVKKYPDEIERRKWVGLRSEGESENMISEDPHDGEDLITKIMRHIIRERH